MILTVFATVAISFFLALEAEFIWRYLNFRPHREARTAEISTTIELNPRIKLMIGSLLFATICLLTRYVLLSQIQLVAFTQA